MPIVASSKFPICLKLSIIGLIILIGIAKPIPSAVDILTVLIPIISPFG